MDTVFMIESTIRDIKLYMNKMKQTRILGKHCKCFLLLLGTVLLMLGIGVRLNLPPLQDYIINKALDIRPGTPAYNAWRTNDPPLILDMYLFNWTNAADLHDSSIKPRFEQTGPYRFKEVKEKVNITFHENKTVSFQYIKKYYFMEEESPKQLNEIITTINPVALTVAKKGSLLSWLEKRAISFSLSARGSILVTKTVDELLFTGFEDPVLNIVRSFAFLMNPKEPVKVEDRFGWFYKRNDTYGLSGDFSMYIGHDENFGKLLSWNHRNRTNFFEGKCNDIVGSAGEFHPMNMQRDFIEVYSSEMCTFAKLEYEKDEVIQGVKAFKYSANTLFDNGTRDPDYACYCNGRCVPSGVLNITSCRMNSPIFLSLPHFYNADPYYTEAIDGLSPSKEKHDFYITLEPKSAIVMDLSARMQLNMLLEPIRGISLFENVPTIMVPVFFFDQVVTTSEELAFKIKILQNLPEICEGAAYTMLLLGGFIVSFVLLHYVVCAVHKSNKNAYKLPQTTLTVEEIPLRIKNDI